MARTTKTTGGTVTTAGADAESNTANTQQTSARISGFNGTTWDRIRTGISGAVSSVIGYMNNLPFAQYVTSAVVMTANQFTNLYTTVSGWLLTSMGDLIAGEDLVANRLMVEQRYSGTLLTADTLVKSGAGFLHNLTISCNDAAPTAGSIIVYDNTAESGTQLFNHTFTTTPFVPFTVTLDVTFSTGLYVGFTTTADVNITPSYR